MQLIDEPMPGVKLFELRVFGDDRGSFCETFNRAAFAHEGVDYEFVQDNQSVSASVGTVRGLHLQLPPHAQGKLVRVLTGVGGRCGGGCAAVVAVVRGVVFGGVVGGSAGGVLGAAGVRAWVRDDGAEHGGGLQVHGVVRAGVRIGRCASMIRRWGSIGPSMPALRWCRPRTRRRRRWQSWWMSCRRRAGEHAGSGDGWVWVHWFCGGAASDRADRPCGLQCRQDDLCGDGGVDGVGGRR